MYGLANCLISVLRGTSTDTWGDQVDNGAIAASGIPARILVRSRTVFDESTQEPRVVQIVSGAVASTADVRDGDQIRDDTHSVTYTVQSVTQPNGVGLVPDLELDLQRVK